MNSQNMVARMVQTVIDLLGRYLNLFGDNLLSHVAAWAILVLGATSIVLLLLGSKFVLRRMARLVAIDVPQDEPRLYDLPLFMAETAAPRPIKDSSPDLHDFCLSLRGAITDLADERREQADRTLVMQDRMHAILLRMESTMAGMQTISDRSGAETTSIDLRLDMLREAVADLGERLTQSMGEHEPQFPSHLPVAKISAEIAEIVRELHAG